MYTSKLHSKVTSSPCRATEHGHSGHLEVAKLLLGHDDIDANRGLNADGTTALIEAAQDNRKDFVQEILNDGKVDVNQGRTRSP